MKQSTYIEEALRRIDSEIFAEPSQMKIILQKELQGLGERIIEEGEVILNAHRDHGFGEPSFMRHYVDLIRSLTLPKS